MENDISLVDIYKVVVKIQDSMITMQADIHRIDKKLDNFKADVYEKFYQIDKKFEEVDARFNQIDEDIKEIKNEIVNSKEEFHKALKESYSKSALETSEFITEDIIPPISNLEKRVIRLENAVFSNSYSVNESKEDCKYE